MIDDAPLFGVGDLAIIIDTLEWNGVVAHSGEICIVTVVYNEHYDYIAPFNYRVALADGCYFDVWANEIVSVEDAHNV